MVFSTHVKEEKNYIAHLWACSGFFDSHMKRQKWYCTFCRPRSGFLDSHMKRKELILHICDFVNGFLIFVEEWKKWYYTFVSWQMVFQLMQEWKGNDITQLWAHKWFFFNSHRWQNKMIFPIRELVNVVLTNTFPNPMGASTFNGVPGTSSRAPSSIFRTKTPNSFLGSKGGVPSTFVFYWNNRHFGYSTNNHVNSLNNHIMWVWENIKDGRYVKRLKKWLSFPSKFLRLTRQKYSRFI